MSAFTPGPWSAGGELIATIEESPTMSMDFQPSLFDLQEPIR